MISRVGAVIALMASAGMSLMLLIHLRLFGEQRGEIFRVGRDAQVFLVPRRASIISGFISPNPSISPGWTPLSVVGDRGEHQLAHHLRVPDGDCRAMPAPML